MIVDVAEQAAGRFPLALVDDAGVALRFDQLAEYRLTLRDQFTATVLNGRDGTQTPAPNVIADVAGLPLWLTQPADAAIVNSRLGYESHVILCDYVGPGGKIGHFVGTLRARNLGIGGALVPPPPLPGAPTWSFYREDISGARPGHAFSLPIGFYTGVVIVWRGQELRKNNVAPGLGEFSLAGANFTTGFEVQPEDSLWAHILA